MGRGFVSVPDVTRVLVPFDFSPSSRAALGYATFLAGRLGAVLSVLYVWDPPGYVGPDTLALMPVALGKPDWEQTRTEVMREIEPFLAEAQSGPPPLDIRVETGEASDAILHVASDVGADLIVMGTHGRTGLSRLLIGSVAESVIRRSTCPVLTVRVPAKISRESVPL